MKRALVVSLLVPITIAAVPAAAGAKTVGRGSVEQVQVTGATPGAAVRLLDRHGRTVALQRAGRLGGIVFRDVKPGAGYRLRVGDGKALAPLRVLTRRSAPPSTALYRQKIPAPGYGYLTTRDG